MSRFHLRYQAMDLELGDGDFIVGRANDCQLVLDDGLVSRQHAAFRVRDGQVEVRDLGSRNGVRVNGAKIDRKTPLSHGDSIRIGSQELKLSDNAFRPQSATGTLEIRLCPSCATPVESDAATCPECEADLNSHAGPGFTGAADQGPGFEVLAGIADKALNMGRHTEAQRMVASAITALFTQIQERATPEDSTLREAARLAMRLAEVGQSTRWLDVAFELYAASERLMSAETIDHMYRLASELRYSNPTAVRNYVNIVKSAASQYGAKERFLLQRLEGLERLVMSA